MTPFVAELHDEQSDLESVLRRLPRDAWSRPTPAAGWDLRDQVSHLADTEEIAHDTATGGPRQLNEEARRFSSPEAYTESMCERGRSKDPADVLEWWVRTAARTREALLPMDPKARIPWGLGMSARTFVTARLMETWAHGQDIRAAAGEPLSFGPRGRNVAWLIVGALPYAFAVSGRPRPPGELRLELTCGGETWSFGASDAGNAITGDAEEFCRLGVQRLRRADARTLVAQGPLADAFLDVARAFL